MELKIASLSPVALTSDLPSVDLSSSQPNTLSIEWSENLYREGQNQGLRHSCLSREANWHTSEDVGGGGEWGDLEGK